MYLPFNEKLISPPDRQLTCRRVLLAILSGLMLTACFPPGRLSHLAWIAIIPLFWSLENQARLNAFKLGFIAGTAHYLTLIYWIVFVIGHYGNAGILLSFIPLLLLCFYLALYTALFSTMTVSLEKSRFLLIFIPSAWVALEYIRARFLTGFPWCLLGYSQYEHLRLIQIADLSGVYGISFLIVLVNTLAYRFLFVKIHKDRSYLKWEALITASILGASLTYGHFRTQPYYEKEPSYSNIKVAVIQPNIDQSIKWNLAYQAKTMATYQRLTISCYDFEPKLIVWPETSVPFFFQDNTEFSPVISTLARNSGAAIIFGSPAYRRTPEKTEYFNRAYLVSPHGQPTQYYDKIHLVPFGEYVPLKEFLFFINRLVTAAGDFQAGTNIGILNFDSLSIGVLICFEAIFPELAREQARRGANMFVNLTNDAWFGLTSAPYQHLSMAVYRCIEYKRPMIRAANTGFSAFIDSRGRICSMSELFDEAVLKGNIKSSHPVLTFYARFGDLFAFILLVITIIMILSRIWDEWASGK